MSDDLSCSSAKRSKTKVSKINKGPQDLNDTAYPRDKIDIQDMLTYKEFEDIQKQRKEADEAMGKRPTPNPKRRIPKRRTLATSNPDQMMSEVAKKQEEANMPVKRETWPPKLTLEQFINWRNKNKEAAKNLKPGDVVFPDPDLKPWRYFFPEAEWSQIDYPEDVMKKAQYIANILNQPKISYTIQIIRFEQERRELRVQAGLPRYNILNEKAPRSSKPTEKPKNEDEQVAKRMEEWKKIQLEKEEELRKLTDPTQWDGQGWTHDHEETYDDDSDEESEEELERYLQRILALLKF